VDDVDEVTKQTAKDVEAADFYGWNDGYVGKQPHITDNTYAYAYMAGYFRGRGQRVPQWVPIWTQKEFVF